MKYAPVSRVLIVEPDQRLARLYTAALEQAGHRVTVASNAQDGILAADKAAPDVVILELQLTAHSGIEFLYELRSYPDWQSVPVILLSHVPPSEFASSQGLLQDHLGVAAYHYKPHTDLRVLSHAVDNVLVAARQSTAGL